MCHGFYLLFSFFVFYLQAPQRGHMKLFSAPIILKERMLMILFFKTCSSVVHGRSKQKHTPSTSHTNLLQSLVFILCNVYIISTSPLVWKPNSSQCLHLHILLKLAISYYHISYIIYQLVKKIFWHFSLIGVYVIWYLIVMCKWCGARNTWSLFITCICYSFHTSVRLVDYM